MSDVYCNWTLLGQTAVPNWGTNYLESEWFVPPKRDCSFALKGYIAVGDLLIDHDLSVDDLSDVYYNWTLLGQTAVPVWETNHLEFEWFVPPKPDCGPKMVNIKKRKKQGQQI